MTMDERQILASNQPVWLHKLNLYKDFLKEQSNRTWNLDSNSKQNELMTNDLGPLFERWVFSFANSNEAGSPHSIQLSMTALCSKNGFRQIAEVCASHFHHEIRAVKQSWDIHELQPTGNSGFRMGPCSFNFDAQTQTGRTQGIVVSKGHELSWDLTFKPRHQAHFNVIPKTFRHPSMQAVTVGEDFLFSGTTQTGGVSTTWTNAPGKQSHLVGKQNFRSWIWAHCNTFSNTTETVILEAFTTQSDTSKLLRDQLIPSQTSFYIHYQGKDYRLNSLWTALRAKSKRSLQTWEFSVETEDLRFTGKWTIQAKDLIGQTLEDTDGALLNLNQTGLAQCELFVYRKGKLEASLKSDQRASIEFASTDPNPYLRSRF